MQVKHLSLLNFRNYKSLELDFAAGNTLILGRNGQGKTNLVEAIAYFDSLLSHRVSNDLPLFLAGTENAVARLQVQHKSASPTLELEFRQKQAKKAQINGNPVKPRELTRWFTSVVFAPEDLQIVRGEPQARRNFLDSAVVTQNPFFAAVFKEYERVVKQRSALLKSFQGQYQNTKAQGLLEFWDAQLIDCATRIMAERRKLIDSLQPYLAQAYSNLVAADHAPQLALKETGAQGAGVTYQPQLNTAANFIADPAQRTANETMPAVDHLSNVSRETLTAEFTAQLQNKQRTEFERGITLVGPHRDDLEITLNGLPVKGYASHGESWSMALGIKLAFAQMLQDDSIQEDPVLILDDVFAELDAARRKRLMAAVQNFEQVIVTAAVAEDIPDGINWNVTVIKVGTVIASGKTTTPAEFYQSVMEHNNAAA